MTKDEYRKARTDLGYNVAGWLEKIGIGLDAHKSYSSGRNPVQQPVENHIKTLYEIQSK